MEIVIGILLWLCSSVITGLLIYRLTKKYQDLTLADILGYLVAGPFLILPLLLMLTSEVVIIKRTK